MIAAAVALTLLHAATCPPVDASHAKLAAVLKANVRAGEVDYTALRKSPAPLDEYVASLEATCKASFDKLPREARLAFLINAYNAAVLRLVATNPKATSIEQISSGNAFKTPVLKVGALIGSAETSVSLDALETAIRELRDPRIHFALVCAAKSCPTLRSEPYTGKQLEAQLEAQTREFLGSARGVVIQKDGVVMLSKLFEWYATDFGGVRKFLARYRPELAADASDYRIAFLPYDWSLNGR